MIEPVRRGVSPSDNPATGEDAQIRRWLGALVAVFAAAGLALASILSRVPEIRDVVTADTGQVSLLLLGMSGGAITGLLLAGRILRGVSPRRVSFVFGTVIAAGTALTAIGAAAASIGIIGAGMVVFGFGMGTIDVAMNLSGTSIERLRGRQMLPFLHAMFSLGTFAGAGLGALAEGIHLSASVHLWIISALLAAVFWTAPRHIGGVPAPGTGSQRARRSTGSAWREPTTLLIGVVVLGMALAEGSANDWLSLTMVDGHDTTKAVGAVTLGLFLGTMTLTRLAGSSLIERFGRVGVVRGSAVVAVAGLLLVIVPDNAAIAMLGAAIWGCGAALGFPLGLSSAADDADRAAQRVSVVAATGYLAFLGGPPLIGFLADQVGLRNALYVVLVAVLISALAAPATRPAATADARA